MVMGEFGGPPHGDDNPLGAQHSPDVDPQVGHTLLKEVADKPPYTVQNYLADQQSLATEANHLRDVLQNSPAQFAHDVIPFLDKEIALGNVARTAQNQPMRTDLMMNFSSQAGWGENAENMKRTLETMGPSALKDPSIHQSVDMWLQFIAGPTLGR
jgi:hypothetical protein